MIACSWDLSHIPTLCESLSISPLSYLRTTWDGFLDFLANANLILCMNNRWWVMIGHFIWKSSHFVFLIFRLFPYLDFSRLLICYRGHPRVPKSVEKTLVAICPRFSISCIGSTGNLVTWIFDLWMVYKGQIKSENVL